MTSPADILNAFGRISRSDLALLSKADPRLYEEITAHINTAQAADEKQRCEDSLIEFFMCAWRHMGEPGELDLNWHHEVIADYLEAQARGECPALIINQPPRTSKTSLASIALPAWIWAQPKERWGDLMGPHVQFFCLSYGATLAEEIAVKHRRLILSPWYQEHWGHQVQLQEDQQNRANFATTMGGGRISNSIEGGILGRGGLWQIVDDPHHLKGAESETMRRETLEGMRSLTTRINNPKKAARTLIMQRLHQDDATNYVLENWSRVKHLMFPMEFDPARAIPEDPRTEEGELLWPGVWDRRAVEQEKKELTDYGVAGQLQQAPVPRGGGIIKRAWWRLWPDDAEREADFMAQYKCYACGWETELPPFHGMSIDCQMCPSTAERRIVYPDVSFSMLSVDTAYSDEDQKTNSWNAITRWGIWHDRTEAPRAILMEMWRGRPPLTTGRDERGRVEKGLVDIVHEMAIRGRVDVVLIERKTRGVDLFTELERQLRTPSPQIGQLNEAYLEHQIRSQITARRNPWAPSRAAAEEERRKEQMLRSHVYRLEYFEPTGRGDKVARLTATSGMFTNDLVWAPAKAWADTVINEVEASPKAQFNDLTDTVSSALIYLRESGLLTMTYEFQAERRREALFHGIRERGGSSVSEMYEGA